MVAITHSITIPKEQEEFLNDNPELSLSAIAQKGISELMENYKVTAQKLSEVQRKVENWVHIADKMRQFIEKRGLFDDYIKEDVS